jgi:phage anti-repressor protein
MTNQLAQTTLDYSLITPNAKGRVTARNLYQFLELDQSNISKWLKSKIQNNKFAFENEDYWGFVQMYEGNQIQDYEITEDFAKKLSMVSKGQRGEDARNYFVARDKKLTQLEKNLPKQLTPAEMMVAQAQLSLDLERRQTQMENQLQQLTSTVHQLETKQIATKDTVTKTNALTSEKAKIKAQKDDIGSEINHFVHKFGKERGLLQPNLKYIDMELAHRKARAEYKTDVGGEYVGAVATSLESKKEYLHWLKTRKYTNQS